MAVIVVVVVVGLITTTQVNFVQFSSEAGMQYM